VLGSLPGEVSLAERRYYAHPTNAFWRLMGDMIGENLRDLEYPERLETLLRHRVGLWDVVAEARRQGSLDSAIRDIQKNNLAELTDRLPNLKALGFNGGKSWSVGSRQFAADRGVTLIALPSSSAAYAGMPYARKREAWMALRAFL
jgi:hypoxanthine-DNA glycosylase